MSRSAPSQESAVAHRTALWFTVVGMFSAAAASLNVVRILGAQTPLRAVLWLGLMLALTATAVYGAQATKAAIVWVTTGGVFGFVAIASGSIGMFFAPAGLLLFAAGIAASIAERAGWRTLWMPVCLVAGASAMAAVTLLISSLQGSVITAPGFSQQAKVVPPAGVMWGSAVFVALLVLLASRAVMRSFGARTR